MLKRFSYRSLLLDGFANVKLPLLLAATLFMVGDFLGIDLGLLAVMLMLISALESVRSKTLSYRFSSILAAAASLHLLKVMFIASAATLGDIHISTAILTDSGVLKALALCVVGFGGLYGAIRLIFLPLALLEKTVTEAFVLAWSMTRHRILELYFFNVLCGLPFLALGELSYYLVAFFPLEWSALMCLALTAYISAGVTEAYGRLYTALEERSEAKMPRS